MILQRSSGLNGERRLALDLPESRAVQDSDHPGAASPVRGEKLGPGQGGACWDQTETNRVIVRTVMIFGFIVKHIKNTRLSI